MLVEILETIGALDSERGYSRRCNCETSLERYIWQEHEFMGGMQRKVPSKAPFGCISTLISKKTTKKLNKNVKKRLIMHFMIDACANQC